MSGRLAAKRAVVTAAAQGIGAAIARAFAAEGAVVIATDINTDALAALAGIDGIAVERLDVTDPAAITAFAQRTGAIDVLANVAGFVHGGTVLDYREDEMDFAWRLNVLSMARLIRAFLPGMVERGRGSIVNVASVASSLKGVPNRFVYGTTKAAVLGLTKSVAIDFVAKGIRCNAICPGTVQSPSLDQRINAAADPVEARRAFIARQPMGRLGTPEEIAALAVHLAGDESAYTTGTFAVIDGGLTC
jgi:2-keto-3-deoxy-L-fuconate dehydrogenase